MIWHVVRELAAVVGLVFVALAGMPLLFGALWRWIDWLDEHGWLP
jgi:hypothetical protein